MMRAQIEVIPCKICGDKSSGVHYGVITCEGCKGFFRRSQLPSVSYSCSRQSNCQIDRASRNRCQHCRLQKCLAQGMSRDAVKFGRMSKRQRDSLFAEVARHRLQQQQQQEQQQQQRHTHCDLLRPRMQRHNNVGPPPLLQPGSAYPFPTGEVAELLPYPTEVHSYLVYSPGESQASGGAYHHHNHHHHRSASLSPVTRTQGRGDSDGRGCDSRQASPDLMGIRTCDHLDELFAPYPHTLKNIDELCASVVRAHRDTSQYTAEDLHTLRWKVFSMEEIHQYQNKSVDEMWAWCSVRVTEAVQFVVEFAKHLPGFRLLSQNDQIALLKTGSMEVVLVRMSRLFNTDNSTVFFDGKFAGAELFKSLGCGDLISAVFDFAHGMCALRLTEQQVALFTALVLINTDRPCLEDRATVQRVQRELELGLTHILTHTHTHEGLVSKLHQRMAVLRSLCRLHVEKLRSFSQRYPLTVQRLFPPLYRELFLSDAEPPTTTTSPPPGGAH